MSKFSEVEWRKSVHCCKNPMQWFLQTGDGEHGIIRWFTVLAPARKPCSQMGFLLLSCSVSWFNCLHVCSWPPQAGFSTSSLIYCWITGNFLEWSFATARFNCIKNFILTIFKRLGKEKAMCEHYVAPCHLNPTWDGCFALTICVVTEHRECLHLNMPRSKFFCLNIRNECITERPIKVLELSEMQFNHFISK